MEVKQWSFSIHVLSLIKWNKVFIQTETCLTVYFCIYVIFTGISVSVIILCSIRSSQSLSLNTCEWMCSKSLTHILQEVEFRISCLQSQQKSFGCPHLHITRCGAPAASRGSCDCVLSYCLVAASTYWCVIGWSEWYGWHVIGWRAADWPSVYAVSALFSKPARRVGRRCSGSAGWWGTESHGTTFCRWPGRCCRACLGAGGHPGVRWEWCWAWGGGGSGWSRVRQHGSNTHPSPSDGGFGSTDPVLCPTPAHLTLSKQNM